MIRPRRRGGARRQPARVAAVAVLSALVIPAHGVTIDWVTVGDPGNAADNTGYGAVADSFQIMRYELTNQQYVEFLNPVAATDPDSLYDTNMSSDFRGGITRSGGPGNYSYAVKANMGDKPVGYVSWFDAARLSNWLMNGATGTSSTETGASTLGGYGIRLASPVAVPEPATSAMVLAGLACGGWQVVQRRRVLPGSFA